MDGRTPGNDPGYGMSPTPETEILGLEDTGERFIPGGTKSPEVAYDHLTRYRLAERYVGDKSVIDLGCGAGYGSHLLAGVARGVVGVDLSEEAVSYAAGRYRATNLRYEVGDVSNLPYQGGSFEAAVSFGVIEHLPQPESLVEEAKRLLKEDGVFVVSTPDKQTYSNERNRVNPHHLKEMYSLEFRELLERHFKYVRIYRQGSLAGSLVTPDPESLPEDGKVEMESARFSLLEPGFGKRLPDAIFMVAVCTNGEPPDPLERLLMVLDRDRQIYEEYDDLQHVPARLRMQHNYLTQQKVHQKNESFRSTNQRLQEANRKVRELRHEREQKNKELQRKNEQLEEANEQLDRLRRERELMINSRGWKIADGINVFVQRVRNILSGRGGR